MGLDKLIRTGAKIANKVTKTLQVTVQHSAWTGDDDYNKPTFAAAVPRLAFVMYGSEMMRVKSGDMIQMQAVVYFLYPIAAVVATGRKNPVDPRDKILLPNGLTGPIYELDRIPADPTTNFEYFHVIGIGKPASM